MAAILRRASHKTGIIVYDPVPSEICFQRVRAIYWGTACNIDISLNQQCVKGEFISVIFLFYVCSPSAVGLDTLTEIERWIDSF